MNEDDEKADRELNENRERRNRLKGYKILDFMTPEMQILWQVKVEDSKEASDHMFNYSLNKKCSYQELLDEYKRFCEMRDKRDATLVDNLNKNS